MLLYNPHEKVMELYDKYGEMGANILSVYNYIDPFHCHYGENVDEYTVYVDRFFQYLLGKGLTIEESVKNSFHPSQWDDGSINQEKFVRIVEDINYLFNPDSLEWQFPNS